MLKTVTVAILIFDQHQKLQISTRPSNVHSQNITIQSAQQFQRIFFILISANKNNLLTLAAMLNFQSAAKT